MSAPAADGFYHLAEADLSSVCCQGTACFVARHLDPDRWQQAQREPRVYCLGKCDRAPAAGTDTGRPSVTIACDTPVLLERLAGGSASTLGDYTSQGGLEALRAAVELDPETVLHEVETSGLRGRGGAAFPTGRKWRTTRMHHRAHGGPAYVVCNADEGDPGAYVDRMLLEEDPFAVLEGMAIAAHAIGAKAGFVYVRREYPTALAAMRRAVDEATAAGILGQRSAAHAIGAFEVEVVEGKGSYVCGEETALLNALEGRRPEVRVRPPYPAEHGLFGAPTVVNNVETLAAVPWIVRHGGAAYAALGSGESRGTKVVSLNSLFIHPGLYEVEFGIPVRRIVDELGGGLRGGGLRGVMIGAPLAGILPPHLLDVPFAFEDLRRIGCDVGHGGIVAFDEHTSIPDLVHHVFRFGAFESCGKCTPCREGTAYIEHVFAQAVEIRASGRNASTTSLASDWEATVEALRTASLCGHGTGLAAFARSVLTHYRREVEQCFA